MIIIAAALSVASLLFVPKTHRGQAQFVLLFVQLPTWLLGLVAVEFGFLRYPVHELSRANSTSFVFEYLILPIYCIHFNAHYPVKAYAVGKTLYYGAAAGSLTIVEIIVEKYTDILEYTGWTWPVTFFSVMFILLLSRVVTRWFFKPHAGASAA
jgi:hypothetical protein